MSNKLKKVPLFNPEGNDSPENQQLINGDPVGIRVSLADDKVTINELTREEDEATQNTLSFLIFLDSFQINNLPNVKEYITAPNVANLIVIQQYQEVIHSQAYQYILDGLYPLMTRESIYNKWRDNPVLLERIEYVAGIGQEFKDDPSEENYKKVIVMNLLLESIYFYQGFMFFDQLASRNKLVQTDKEIDYIRNDEMTHIGIFVNIIRELFSKEDEPMIIDMFKTAVNQEIEWAHHVYGDNILGISKKSSEEYVKYLANDRVALLGIDPIYPEVTKNPYSHLEGKKRENFFESGAVTSYDRSETVDGWGDF